MMIGHGSRPKPFRTEAMAIIPTMVTVGMARPMLTASAAASSPRRRWARHGGRAGRPRSRPRGSAIALCHTVATPRIRIAPRPSARRCR